MTKRQRLQPLGDAERVQLMVAAGGREGIDYPLSAQNVPAKFGMARSEWEWRVQNFGSNFSVYLLHRLRDGSGKVYAIPATDFKRELDQELDGQWEQTTEGERLTIDLPKNEEFIRIRARSPKKSERLIKSTYERSQAQTSRVRGSSVREAMSEDCLDDLIEETLRYQPTTAQFEASELLRLLPAIACTGNMRRTKAWLKLEDTAQALAEAYAEIRRVLYDEHPCPV